MSWEILNGQWNQFTGHRKATWGKLMDDGWSFVGGKKDALVGKIPER